MKKLLTALSFLLHSDTRQLLKNGKGEGVSGKKVEGEGVKW